MPWLSPPQQQSALLPDTELGLTDHSSLSAPPLQPATDLVEQMTWQAMPVAGALPTGNERPAPPPPPDTVPMASWWSDQEVEMAPGRWCRKPPPYALPKPALPTRSPPFDEKPLLSAAMARQHASPDNMLIVTYVNKNRLDFALTWVRHLLAANQPHRSRFRAL